MKILFITLHVSLGGGAEVSLLDLVTALNRRGVETVVAYHGTDSKDAIAAFSGAGAKLYAVASRPRTKRIWQLRRIIASERPQLVHTIHDGTSIVGSLAACGTNLPALKSIIAVAPEPRRAARFTSERIRQQRWRIVERWTVRHLTDHFHALSRTAEEAEVARLGIPPERVTIVVRGRDPDRLGTHSPDRRRRSRVDLGVDQDVQVIVGIGRLSPSKGWRFLLEAFDLLAPSHPRAVLLIAGRPDPPTYTLTLSESPFADRVRLLGHRDDVSDILAAADIFALPTLSEGMSGATIEAMALALPVVASDLPSLQEVVSDGRSGILVPPRDPRRLAGAISELLDDPDRAHRLGARGREIFVGRFTSDTVGGEMINLYDRVIAGGRQRAASRASP